ncbi:MAG: alpha/beta hydrolase [Spirochaetales bacterium]|jgi:haloalkane dehalogenase|nr:alpha/beta hydrolase [Spirochaetales bacterium]
MKFLFLSTCLLLFSVLPGWSYNPGSFAEHSAEQSKYYLDEHDSDIGELFLAYVDAGPENGRPVLLVHGVPTSSWSYRKVAANLAALGYRVILPDNLGFGNSAKPKGKEIYDLAEQGRRLLGLMAYLKIDGWIQILHDVGGPISWEMMAVSPEKIERLVILNTFAYEEGWHPPKSLDNPIVQFSMGVIGFKSKAVIRATICDMFALPEIVDNDTALGGYYEPLQSGADKAYLAFMTSFDSVRARLPLYRKTLRSNQIPSIIIWGAQDETLNGEESIPLFQEDLGIPSENIYIREDAKHLIMEELPVYIVDRMLIFAPPIF